MQNEGTDLPTREKRTAKSCCLLTLTIVLALFLLVLTAIAGIIIADTIQLRGEGLTLERRAERYKVAAQFIWVDFTRWVSRRFSDTPPMEDEQMPGNEPPTENEPPPGDEPPTENEPPPGDEPPSGDAHSF